MASLILYPADSAWCPTQFEDLSSLLQTDGLAGESLPPGSGAGFFIGDKFLNRVTFLGCAPAINLEPDHSRPDVEFCSIRIQLEKAAPRLLIASRYPPPRCPHCRSSVAVNIENLAADSEVACSRCHVQTPVHALNWRKSAGYARCFVEITGVYPREAVPTEVLLKSLRALSGCEWRYFYR